MADRPPPNVTRQKSEAGGKTGLALIVGGLVVAVAIIAYVMFGADDSDDVNVTIEGGESAVEDAGTAMEGAADEAGDAVEDAGDAVEDAVDPAEPQPAD